MKIPAHNFLSCLFSINPSLLPFQLQLPFYFISFVREVRNFLSSVSLQQKFEGTDGPVLQLSIGQGVCNFPSSVSLQQKFEATDGPDLQLSFIWQAKENASSRQMVGCSKRYKEKRGQWFNFGFSFYILFFSSPEPALCNLGQPGGLFVSPEVLTLVLRPSFVPLLWAFSFLCLLATTNLDSFFLF